MFVATLVDATNVGKLEWGFENTVMSWNVDRESPDGCGDENRVRGFTPSELASLPPTTPVPVAPPGNGFMTW